MIENNPAENVALRSKKKSKKFSPYKKDKHTLSKLKEYKNYLNTIHLMSRGLEVDL